MCLSRKPPTVGLATFLARKLIEQRLGLLQNGRIAALNSRTSSAGSLGLPKSAHADATLWQFLDGYEATDLEERAKLVCGGRWPVDQ